ncbi:MAG: M56 family metallopeptidase [Planctomycetota bacterium JB042]
MNASSIALVERLGQTVVHSLWQGALIGAVAALLLARLGRRDASARYAVAALGLAALLSAPAVTFFLLGDAGTAAPGAGSVAALVGVTAAAPLQRLLPLLGGLWILGTTAMLARTLVQFARARRLARRGTTAAPATWRRRLSTLRARLGVKRAVRLLVSARVAGPVVVGWLRPTILVPAAVFAGLAPTQLEAVLAHELAHVRRHDFLVNLMQSVAEALLFFHPVAWWLSARVREERESCCDDLAVRVAGDRIALARGLAALDSLSADATHAPALAARGGALMKRIERIVHSEPESGSRGPAAGAALVVLGLLAGLVPASGAAVGDGDERKVVVVRVRTAAAGEKAGAEHAARTLKSVLGTLPAEERHAAMKLRELGMSDAELLELLSRSTAGEEVREALASREARTASNRTRSEPLHLHLRRVEEKLSAGVAAGKLTDAEAKEKLRSIRAAAAKKEGPQRTAVRVRSAGPALPAGAKVRPTPRPEVGLVLKKIEAAVAAGRLTKEEAAPKIEALRKKLSGGR